MAGNYAHHDDYRRGRIRWMVESHEKGVQQQTNIDAINAISALVDDADAIQQTFLANDDAGAI
jgi:hypothetical protein